jgi:hypothetical protein
MSTKDRIKHDRINPAIVLLFAAALLCVVPACSVNVKKQANGQEKQVDIDTPVGAIHVGQEANPGDLGMAVYPGARPKEKDSSGDDKSANVNISGFGYGVKVVALEYESNDAPAKIVSYYKDQLKKYGSVLVCHTSHFDMNAQMKDHDQGPQDLSCEGDSGVNVELKVGTKQNQHIVAIKPEGNGSSFSLVYVRTHGKEADI